MENEYYRLKDLIYEGESGAQVISLFEQAIRMADTLNLEDEGFELRQDLITECNEYGYFMKAIIAFSWNLARVEEGKYPFDFNMSWDYRAVLSRAAAFDSISLEQIEKLFADFKRHMTALGATDSSYHCRRLRTALHLHDEQMTRQVIKDLRLTKRDQYTDCEACIQNHLVESELYFGSWEKAQELYKPIKWGKLSCNMIPLRTYGFIVNPAHRNGEAEMAKEASEKGIRLIGNKSGFLEQIGLHMIYLSETDARKGLALFRKSLLWALSDAQTPWGVMHHHLGAYILFARLSAAKKGGKMILSSTYPCHQPSGSYVYADLADWHRGEVFKLAERFDKRNGTKNCTAIIKREEGRL